MVFGLMLGLSAGMWLGVNHSQGDVLYANPLADKNLPGIEKSLKTTGMQFGQFLEQSGKSIQNKMQG